MHKGPADPKSPLRSVLCPSYHGATLLAVLLGNHPDVVTLADTVPTDAFAHRCSCGLVVRECEFWIELARELGVEDPCKGAWFPLVPGPRSGRTAVQSLLVAAHERRPPMRVAGPLGMMATRILGPYADRRLGHGDTVELQAQYDTIERIALRAMSGSIYVDGSKSLTRQEQLARGTNRPLRVVHLIRHPCAFYGSWVRNTGAVEPSAAGAHWRSSHRRIAGVVDAIPGAQRFELRYEDLCREPRAVMQRVFGFLGVVPYDPVHAIPDGDRRHLMGNKMVFAFDGTVRLDVGWKKRVPMQERRGVLRGAKMLAGEHGYTLEGVEER